MKKYTIIYTVGFPSGSGWATIPQFREVTKKKKETFKDVCDDNDIDPGSISFIFHGWMDLVEGEWI